MTTNRPQNITSSGKSISRQIRAGFRRRVTRRTPAPTIAAPATGAPAKKAAIMAAVTMSVFATSGLWTRARLRPSGTLPAPPPCGEGEGEGGPE
nr:hypothetical protein [Chenggangzhangella methanolivorans]